MTTTSPSLFFTLAPADSCLPIRSIALLTADVFEISVGGTRIDRDSRAAPPVHTATFNFDMSCIPVDHATISYAYGVIRFRQDARSGTTRLNGRPLDQFEDVLLHDNDYLELGYYETVDGTYNFELGLHVSISLSPPALSGTRSQSRPRPPTHFIPTTSTFLQAFQALQDSMQRLSAEHETVKQQLQEIITAAEKHTCASPSPPRPYGALLEDLRDRVEGGASSTSTSHSSSASMTTSASSAASDSSSAASQLTDTSSSSQSRRDSSTSVLTSVLRSGLQSPSTLCSDGTPSPFHPFPYDDAVSPSSNSSTPGPTTSVLTSVLGSVPSSVSSPASVQDTAPQGNLSPTLVSSPHVSSLCTAPTSSNPSKVLVASLSGSVPIDILSDTAVSAPQFSCLSRPLCASAASGSLNSAFIAMERIRAAWMAERESQFNQAAPLPSFSRPVSSVTIVLSRIRSAWVTARKHMLLHV
ncbi:hypothetical protein CF326_g8818 [Tilletia indica]|nr:hypothetical protein CF326_g8818 [Tilletia indica]